MELYKTKAVIFDGQLKLANPEHYKAWVRAQSGPLEVFVIIKKAEKKRSNQANALWESLVHRLSDATGEAFDELRTKLKLMYGVSFVFNEHFSPDIVRYLQGQFVPWNGEYVYLVSTACYNKEQFKNLIEGTIKECAELGVYTEDMLS